MALTKAQKRAKKLKKKKNQPLQPMKVKEDSLDGISQILGISTKVGEKSEAFSSGRISVVDRVSYKSPTEEDLLIKFKKSILEENFKRISDYAGLYADFEERFYEHDRSVDVESMNNTLTQEEVLYYFTECPDTGMDLINNMADLASYAKNKDYVELQKNILIAYKKTFKPRMVGMCTKFKDIPENMNDIILGVRSVQARYVEGAPYIACVNNIKINSIKGRTKAFLEYMTQMQEAASNPMFAATNDSIAKSEDLLLKPKRSRLSMSEVVGLNASYAVEVNKGTQEELIEQSKPLIKEFKELESKLKVIPDSMINSNGVLDYLLAKQAFKSSGLKLGSTDDYLKTFKPMYLRMIALINSLCEIAFVNNIDFQDNLEDSDSRVSLFIEKELNIEVKNQDFYNPLMNAVERSVSKFIIFCEEKDLNWSNETSLKKAAGKFNISNSLGSWRKNVYIQEKNEANKILGTMLTDRLKSTEKGRRLVAFVETDKFADSRKFIYTQTMLSIRAVVEGCNDSEDKLLEYMNLNSVLAFSKELEQAIDYLSLFINDNNLLEYNFDKADFVDLTKEDRSKFINNFATFIEMWLLYINNTVSFYYFSKKVGFKKITKQVEAKIDLLSNLLDNSDNLDYLQKLEDLAKLIPEVLIFAIRKGYKFNSVEKADILNKRFNILNPVKN